MGSTGLTFFLRFPYIFGGAFIEVRVLTVVPVASSLFPFLLGGAFVEARRCCRHGRSLKLFPFLFGGAFIEADPVSRSVSQSVISLSFSEGLSLRPNLRRLIQALRGQFPCFFVGTFIEATERHWQRPPSLRFPFLFFGRAFIEAAEKICGTFKVLNFPSSSEGLSIRQINIPSG